jgi:hypothetical protein
VATVFTHPDEMPALRWARERWADGTRAAFLRLPVADAHTPRCHDLDLMVFGPVASFRPERRVAPDGTPIDIAWYPAALLDDGERIARSGLAAHRLAASMPVWGDGAAACQQAALAALTRPAVQAARIEVFLDMPRLTVREIGVTGDFPALARFWLQMGHAGCLAALADLAGIACPNVYTRPFGALEALSERTGHDVAPDLAAVLGLEGDAASVAAVADAVRGLHAIVSARFAHPPWPAAMREATRAEYAYTLDADELAWRLAVADELARGGRVPAALWYLRYWAYALARLVMVWHAAQRGEDIAFLRPERAVRPALAAQCPELLPPLEQALGGPGCAVTPVQIRAGIDHLAPLRHRLTRQLELRAIPVAAGTRLRTIPT